MGEPGRSASEVLDLCLQEVRREFRSLKRLAEKSLAQVSDDDFFAALDPGSNSAAVLVKHLAGNLRSRWTDFLTSDGEKPDRRRDSEFEIGPDDTRASLAARWEDGWRALFAALEALAPEDLSREILIRGERLSVVRAINRQLTHYADHVGQIVLLSKHWAGERWQTLSIPRGKSEEFNRATLPGAGEKHKP
ncbi:MAG: DUF1572 family protein [Acidobacteriota bacterium]